MIVQVHAFDWAIYTNNIMPAFARWLIDKDETPIYQLFEHTRCALEEKLLPDPMKRLRTWPRAKSFVDSLPRGPHSRREYARLCSAEQFAMLGDQYLHHHAPHLYQNSSALRTIWGAIIEEYCLPWFHATGKEIETKQAAEETVENEEDDQAARGELVTLLHKAGLAELARDVGEKAIEVERFEQEPNDDSEPGAAEEFDLYADEESTGVAAPQGIVIGQHSNTLRLRGWLAGTSIRAMALFEYLACGRRRMPFGYEPGEPFGAYCGYLMPGEIWQLAALLRNATLPSPYEAEEDYSIYSEHIVRQETFRLIDEILPTNASELLNAVRRAALQGSGLICSID